MAGHIRKRTSPITGKTTYQAKIPSPLNPRKDTTKTFERKRAAEIWLANQTTNPTPNTTATFADLTAQWRQTKAPTLAPKTLSRYEGIIRNYLAPTFGRTMLANLRKPAVKSYFAQLDASPAQAKKVQIVLSSILSEGVELDLIRENPASRLRLRPAPPTTMTVLDAREVHALAEAMPTPSDKLAVYMAAYTGLRASELWALQAKHIDGDQLRVERTVSEVSGKLVFRPTTKTASSRRTVALPTFLTNMLAEHLPSDPEALVFTAHQGGPVRHTLFRKRVFIPAVKKALPAKPNLRWHDLRHTCASLLIQSGASILVASKRLGHSKVSMTLDVYGHLYPSDEAACAVALDAIHDNVVPLRAPEPRGRESYRTIRARDR